MDHFSKMPAAAAHGRMRRKRAPIVPRDVLDQDILSALASADVPLGAYQLATALRDGYHGVPVVSIYRALDRLVDEGRVQRVETLSAYRVRDATSDPLIVCISCGRTSSLAASDARAALLTAVAHAHFTVSRLVVEALGRCERCAVSEPGPASHDR